ncbi:MAG: hypothetical protein ACI4DY_00755, partial [Monoglobaceae bacterium]
MFAVRRALLADSCVDAWAVEQSNILPAEYTEGGKMKVLVSNVGSTSLKFKLFEMPSERAMCEAKVERVGSLDKAFFSYQNLLSGVRYCL